MATSAKLSSRFRISIPKEIRDSQNWREGQELVFLPKGRGVLLFPVPKLEDLFGIARGANKEGYRDRKDRY